MIGFFKRWKHNKSEGPANQTPIASFCINIYYDKAEFNINGDEMKIGSALVTLLLNSPYARRIVTNAVITAGKEHERQQRFSQLMTINLN